MTRTINIEPSKRRNNPRFSFYAIPQTGQKRICFSRIRWESGVPGDGVGHSNKLSISVCWKPQDLWVGAYFEGPKHQSSSDRFTLYVCIIPCLPIRIKHVRSYGGIIP